MYRYQISREDGLFFLNESSLSSAIGFGFKRITTVKIPTKPRIEAPPSGVKQSTADLQEEEFDNVANMVIGSRDVVVSRALGQWNNVSGTSVSFRSFFHTHSDDPIVAASRLGRRRGSALHQCSRLPRSRHLCQRKAEDEARRQGLKNHREAGLKRTVTGPPYIWTVKATLKSTQSYQGVSPWSC